MVVGCCSTPRAAIVASVTGRRSRFHVRVLAAWASLVVVDPTEGGKGLSKANDIKLSTDVASASISFAVLVAFTELPIAVERLWRACRLPEPSISSLPQVIPVAAVAGAVLSTAITVVAHRLGPTLPRTRGPFVERVTLYLWLVIALFMPMLGLAEAVAWLNGGAALGALIASAFALRYARSRWPLSR